MVVGETEIDPEGATVPIPLFIVTKLGLLVVDQVKVALDPMFMDEGDTEIVAVGVDGVTCTEVGVASVSTLPVTLSKNTLLTTLWSVDASLIVEVLNVWKTPLFIETEVLP